MSMKRKTFWIPIGVTVSALAVWAFVHRDPSQDAAYRFVAVERGALESVVTSTGTLQATETVEVGTQVSGQIAQLFVDFNDSVKKGQLLARIDPTILEQEVRGAEANVIRTRADLQQSERVLSRNRELYGSRVITDSELEQSEYAHTVAEAAFTSAEVALERTKGNLAYTEIRSPIDGVVVERSVDVGQTVAASMSAPVLFVIARDLSEMQILASVDESDIGRIAEGQDVRFTVQAHGDESFTGTVEQVRLQSKAQDNVVSYGVVVRVDNPEGRLLPGMTATVAVVAAKADDVLKIPNAALRFQPPDAMRAAALEQREAGGTGANVRDERASARVAGDSAGVNGIGERADIAEIETARNAMREASGAGARAMARSIGTVNRGMLWIVGGDGRPSVVPVRTGLTDGQYTEIAGVGVEEGMQVIAAVTDGRASQSSPVSPNPFQGSSSGNRGGSVRMF